MLDAIIISPYSLQTPIPFVQIKGIGFVYTKYRFLQNSSKGSVKFMGGNHLFS